MSNILIKNAMIVSMDEATGDFDWGMSLVQ
jgi:hypothetical protein